MADAKTSLDSKTHAHVVWGVNQEQKIYARAIPHGQPTGGQWKEAGGAATGIGACKKTGVWVVNKEGRIYYRTGITHETPEGTAWTQAPGGKCTAPPHTLTVSFFAVLLLVLFVSECLNANRFFYV